MAAMASKGTTNLSTFRLMNISPRIVWHQSESYLSAFFESCSNLETNGRHSSGVCGSHCPGASIHPLQENTELISVEHFPLGVVFKLVSQEFVGRKQYIADVIFFKNRLRVPDSQQVKIVF